MTELSKQLDKTYLLIVNKKGYDKAAEFLKALIVKYDVIEKKGKKK